MSIDSGDFGNVDETIDPDTGSVPNDNRLQNPHFDGIQDWFVENSNAMNKRRQPTRKSNQSRLSSHFQISEQVQKLVASQAELRNNWNIDEDRIPDETEIT